MSANYVSLEKKKIVSFGPAIITNQGRGKSGAGEHNCSRLAEAPFAYYPFTKD